VESRFRWECWRGWLPGAAIALAAISAPATAAEIVRGPYLQRGAPTGAIVRWRTDVATSSRLELGPTPDALEVAFLDLAPTTEHRAEVGGLDPETLYYYAVGTDLVRLAGGDAAHRFRTAPPPGVSRRLRVWAVGDGGEATPAQADVIATYVAEASSRPADVWLLLGDNAYDQGTDGQYQAALFAPFSAILRETFLWPVLGNHDAISSDSGTLTGPYFEAFSLPRWGESGGLASGTEAYYSFDWGPVHFVALDSADSPLAPPSPMLDWLAADLVASSLPWTVAFLHHPPYTKGSHDSDDPQDSEGRMIAVRENVLPLLEAGGVDLVLVGHSHGYERSYLLDGHYGYSWEFDPLTMRLNDGDGDPAGDGAYVLAPGAHGGAVYVVAGSVSRVAAGDFDHPAHLRGEATHGALYLDVDGDRISVRFLDRLGVEVDRFTLVKPGTPLFADGFESGDLVAWRGALP